MPSYVGKYAELYEFLSLPKLTKNPTGNIVFGRKNKLVARKFVELAKLGRSKWAIITGGKGKDSGNLETPEAQYLLLAALSYALEGEISLPAVYTDPLAKNGGDNVRNSLDIIQALSLNVSDGVTAVIHATSALRLGIMLEDEVNRRGLDIPVFWAPTDYTFVPSQERDQKEAVLEAARLVEWPDRGMLPEYAKTMIPSDLADFALDMKPRFISA